MDLLLNVFIKLILILSGICVLLVLYFIYCYSYWRRRNVFYLRPKIPFGNFKRMLSGECHLTKEACDIYKELKAKGQKFGGLYFVHTPVLMPIDPNLIKSILSTDFDYFTDRGVYFDMKRDPLQAHLFNLPPDLWRILRTKMTPTFSSSKLKNMYNLVGECGDGIIEAIDKFGEKPFDINDLVVRFTVDTIGKCVFGIECNSLKTPDEEFRLVADKIKKPPIINGINFFLALICPDLVKYFRLRIQEKYVGDFFLDIIQKNVDYREKNNVTRNDFFQLMLELKKKDANLADNVDMKMTLELMAAQAFVFFAAGFETSSMTIDLCLLELAWNMEIQEKCRDEIRKVMKEEGGKLTYDAIHKLQFMKQCIYETLRKYPPLGFLNRYSVADYKIPDTDIVIQKGTKVLISLQGIQNDPEYYPDPDKFDPDRFSEENKDANLPFTFMPFGEGLRNCIGKRFGMVQVLVCIASVLSTYEVTVSPLMKPLEWVSQAFTLSIKSKILLQVKRLK